MTTHNRLRLAILLMLAGLVPFLTSMVWLVSGFAAAANGKVFFAEALMKTGFAYMCAVIVGCGGATAIGLLVPVLLLAPLMIGMS